MSVRPPPRSRPAPPSDQVDGPLAGGPGAAVEPAWRAWRTVVLLALLVIATAFAVGRWLQLGVPVPVPEPGASRIDCVSYAPFRRPGDSPFDPLAFIDESRIESDLRALSGRTGCVRTYSVTQGLDAVPRVARRLGMTVLLGAWIGRDRADNERELARAMALARDEYDVVRALIVGNEVMLRRELPEAELAALIRRARAEVPVPVTYADVWEFWLKHPSLAPAVSFVTIHVLPYWEDEPVGIDAAVAHVIDVYRLMRREFPGRDILLGETGWPSEGRARRDAVPGRVEQARFVRGFVAAAAGEGLRYNLIEGFDQPWKRRLEGAMGGYWGVLDSDARPKFDWTGPVAPREDVRPGLRAALAGAIAGLLAMALLGWRQGRQRRTGAAPVLLHAAIGLPAGAGLGATLAEQWRYMTIWNRDPLEWGATAAMTIVVLGTCLVGAVWFARQHAIRPPPIPGMAAVVRDWRRHDRAPGLDGWLGLLSGLVLLGVAVTALLHAFDARYRGFPWPLFAPAAVTAGLLWCAGLRRDAEALEERWLATLVLACALLMVFREGPLNLQALGYAALLAVLAGTAAARTTTISPSSAPTAAGS